MVLAHDQGIGEAANQRDVNKIIQGLVAGGLPHQRPGGDGRAVAQHPGVAVGGCLGRYFGAEHRAIATAVVDQHRLAQRMGHPFCQQTGNGVARAPGGKGHDPLDGPAGISAWAGRG